MAELGSESFLAALGSELGLQMAVEVSEVVTDRGQDKFQMYRPQATT
jgi:hypothetical protein